MTLSRSRSPLAFLALVAAVLAPAGTAAAQDLMTADAAVRIALQNNPQVVTSRADVLNAKSGVYSAYGGVLPRVTGSWSRSGSWTSNTRGSQAFGSVVTPSSAQDVESYGTTPQLSASWPVLDLSALKGLSAAGQSLRAAKLTQAGTRNDVALGVRRQFYTAVRAVHTARVNADALRLARDNERRVHALFDVGSVSKSDVLQAQVQTAQAQLDSLTAANDIVVQRIALANQLGVAEQQMAAIDTTLAVSSAGYDEAALLAQAERGRPDLKAAEASLKAARSSRTAARLARLPYVTATGTAVFNSSASQKLTDLTTTPHDVTSADSKTDRTYRAALALNWDLFDAFSTDSRNASAQASLVRAQENYDVLRRNLAGEVHQSLLSYNESIVSVEVAERAVASASENLKLVQQKYNVGSATILDLVNAQVALQRANNQLVAARAGVQVAAAGIRRVTGQGE